MRNYITLSDLLFERDESAETLHRRIQLSIRLMNSGSTEGERESGRLATARLLNAAKQNGYDQLDGWREKFAACHQQWVSATYGRDPEVDGQINSLRIKMFRDELAKLTQQKAALEKRVRLPFHAKAQESLRQAESDIAAMTAKIEALSTRQSD